MQRELCCRYFEHSFETFAPVGVHPLSPSSRSCEMRRSMAAARGSLVRLPASRSPLTFVSLLLALLLVASAASAIATPAAGAVEKASKPGHDLGTYISSGAKPGSFPLVAAGTAAPLVVSASDYPGVV